MSTQNTTPSRDELFARAQVLVAGGAGRPKLIAELGISDHLARVFISRIKGTAAPPVRLSKATGVITSSHVVIAPSETDAVKLADTAAKMLRGGKQATFADIRNALGCDVDAANKVVGELESRGAVWHGSFLLFAPPSFGSIRIADIDASGEIVIGAVSDTHLACKESRLDALHATYDRFAAEGIRHVLHAGNLVDGYVPKINGDSALVTSIDGQCQFVVDNYPARPGITTHFITGDDHEGWWQKTGFNYGYHQQLICERAGRFDLKYIGHVEADVRIAGAMFKVQHPGGGSSYARSYTGQKQVEAFQGGEKPHVLLQGHYHVSNYMVERGVYVIGLPGFQDQTVFARKKRLRMEVGGAILRFRVDSNGVPSRMGLEWLHYFDRGYYQNFLRSDARLLKGRVVLSAEDCAKVPKKK